MIKCGKSSGRVDRIKRILKKIVKNYKDFVTRRHYSIMTYVLSVVSGIIKNYIELYTQTHCF